MYDIKKDNSQSIKGKAYICEMKLLAEIKREECNYWAASIRQLIEKEDGELVLRYKKEQDKDWIYPAQIVLTKENINPWEFFEIILKRFAMGKEGIIVDGETTYNI